MSKPVWTLTMPSWTSAWAVSDRLFKVLDLGPLLVGGACFWATLVGSGLTGTYFWVIELGCNCSLYSYLRFSQACCLELSHCRSDSGAWDDLTWCLYKYYGVRRNFVPPLSKTLVSVQNLLCRIKYRCPQINPIRTSLLKSSVHSIDIYDCFASLLHWFKQLLEILREHSIPCSINYYS